MRAGHSAQNYLFCAASAGRTGRLIPVQVGGSRRAPSWSFGARSVTVAAYWDGLRSREAVGLASQRYDVRHWATTAGPAEVEDADAGGLR
jgi:hypothetical protein